MADEKTPETPAPKIAPQTGQATGAAAPTGSPAAGQTASAPATGAKPAATPHATTTPAARPAAAPRPAARRRFPISPARRRPRRPPAAPPPRRPRPPSRRGRRDARSRRHLAAPDAPRLDGPRLGSVLRRVGRRAGGHRPLHVPERAQRAAAAVQGGVPDRVRGGRGRALEGEIRRLDRAHAQRRRRAVERLLRAARHLHAPRLHAELSVGRGQVQVPVPRQRIPRRPASTSRARRRGRSSARASCSPTTARFLVDKARKFQYELGQWTDPEAFLKV